MERTTKKRKKIFIFVTVNKKAKINLAEETDSSY